MDKKVEGRIEPKYVYMFIGIVLVIGILLSSLTGYISYLIFSNLISNYVNKYWSILILPLLVIVIPSLGSFAYGFFENRSYDNTENHSYDNTELRESEFDNNEPPNPKN